MAEADAPTATATGKTGGETTRREFLERIPWVTTAWVALTVAVGGALTASLRFMYPNVLYEPPQQFKIGFPTAFQTGVVSTASPALNLQRRTGLSGSVVSATPVRAKLP